MKIPKLLLTLAILGLANAGKSQDCKSYLFLQKNKTIENTIYNKKGEPNGRQVYSVSDVASSGSVTSGTVNSELFDKKDKSLAKATSVVRCNGGVMMIDMKMLLPQQQQEQYAGKIDAKAEDVYLEYPNGIKVGDALKDGTMTLNINNNGMNQTVNMLINDRKVEGEESVTTPAGTWNCLKISYKCKIGVKTGPINIPFSFEGTEWYAPGVGIIKSQSKYGGTAITAIK
ncbi:MAG: hypothetical protein JST68_17520 [Bacteroidetes bacterium]|nr:hypothetical protein [Bacteroidota bacterium]